MPFVNDPFVVAVTYCLGYEQLGQSPDLAVLRRLRNGDTPQNDQERTLHKIMDVVRFTFEELPDRQSPDDFYNHLRQVKARLETEGLGDPQVALISGGATKIKQYVFESAKLPEIRGASALLDQINLVGIPTLFHSTFDEFELETEDRDLVEQVRADFARRHTGTQLLNCPECIIYANGGEVLAFAPVSLAQELADEIEYLYTSQTGVANSVTVWKPFHLVELVGGLQPVRLFERLEEASYKQALLSELDLSYEEITQKKCFGELAADLALEKFRRREGNATEAECSPGDKPRESQQEGQAALPEGRDHNENVLRRAKLSSHWETVSYGRRCRSCERRVASRQFDLAGDDQPVCEPCFQKLKVGWELKRTWVARFESFLQKNEKGINYAETYYLATEDREPFDVRNHYHTRRWDGKTFPDRPQDLNEIGLASQPQGYVGVIYADGNNMGALLEHLRTPHSYKTFAQDVHRATLDAVFNALKDLRPHKIDREERRGGKPYLYTFWIHPFEILSVGGDDVFLIVPADKAIEIALSIAAQIEQRLSQQESFQRKAEYVPQNVHRCALDDEDLASVRPFESTVSLSAGVLLADAKTPIFFLQQLVEQLLKSAKTKAKKLKKDHHYYGGTIDFLSLKSVTMLTDTLDNFRKESFGIGENSLTARPYTLLEMRKLIETVRGLKQAKFPRSQLYALRQALWNGRLASTVDYLYFTERLDEKSRKHLREVLDECWCGNRSGPMAARRKEKVGDRFG